MQIIKGHPEKTPDTYLFVREERSGETWTMPLRDNASLDIEKQVRTFVRLEWGGELFVVPPFGKSGLCDYSATIYMDGREPDSATCWASCGFFLTPDLDEVRTASLAQR